MEILSKIEVFECLLSIFSNPTSKIQNLKLTFYSNWFNQQFTRKMSLPRSRGTLPSPSPSRRAKSPNSTSSPSNQTQKVNTENYLIISTNLIELKP